MSTGTWTHIRMTFLLPVTRGETLFLSAPRVMSSFRHSASTVAMATAQHLSLRNDGRFGQWMRRRVMSLEKRGRDLRCFTAVWSCCESFLSLYWPPGGHFLFLPWNMKQIFSLKTHYHLWLIFSILSGWALTRRHVFTKWSIPFTSTAPVALKVFPQVLRIYVEQHGVLPNKIAQISGGKKDEI